MGVDGLDAAAVAGPNRRWLTSPSGSMIHSKTPSRPLT